MKVGAQVMRIKWSRSRKLTPEMVHKDVLRAITKL
jgi:hypothetical protein